MFSALAEMPPRQMASRVTSASGVAIKLVNAPVGSSPRAAPGLTTVAAAAPTTSSSTQDRNRPANAHQATAVLLTVGFM